MTDIKVENLTNDDILQIGESTAEHKTQFILFDMEVYKYDWLAGFKIHNTGEYVHFHNDTEGLLKFIDEHTQDMFFTINGERYDNNILEAILTGKDPYVVSQDIIVRNIQMYARYLPIVLYDLSKQKTFYPSLKAFESNNGMSIEELPLDPTLDRRLTNEELALLIEYNKHDLDATELSMIQRMPESISVKGRLIKYFGLSMRHWISRTIVSIATRGLGAKRGKFPTQHFTFDGIFSKIQIKNEEVRRHLLEERFYNEDLIVNIAGIDHYIRKGGLHAAIDGYYECTDCWHVDFASFYPSIMIQFDLLSRALDEKGKQKFLKVREDRYIAKANKSPDDIALKEVINSMFGAANSEYSDLYDPSRSLLVCMYGQALAIDLTEKLEPYVKMIQSNTDGIMFELKEKTPEYEAHMRRVIAEFTERTGLKMDIEHYEKLCQKDVNNYVAIMDGKIQSKGGMTNLWDLHPSQSHYRGTYRLFQTTVVDRAVTFNLLYGKPCEETVQEEFDAKNWFRFQSTSKMGKMYHRITLVEESKDYISKVERINALLKNREIRKILKGTPKEPGFNIDIKDYNDFVNKLENDEFDDIQLEALKTLGIEYIHNTDKEIDIQHTNRVFASNDKTITRTIYKYKWVDEKINKVSTGRKKLSRSKIGNLPQNVFIYNGDMKDFEKHAHKLDLQWYIDKAYRDVAFYKSKEKFLDEKDE